MGGIAIKVWEIALLEKCESFQQFATAYAASPEEPKRDLNGILHIWKQKAKTIARFKKIHPEPVPGPIETMEGNIKLQQQMPLSVPVTFALGATIRTNGNQFLKFDVHGCNSSSEAKEVLISHMRNTARGAGLLAANEFIEENFRTGA